MSAFVTFLGWVAAVVGTLSGVPQLVRVLRERKSAGISLPTWVLQVGAALGWFTHGILVGRPNVILPNLLIAIVSAAVVVMVCRDRERSEALPLAGAAAIGGGMLAVEVFLGPVIFGLLIAMPLLIGQATQFWELWKDSDITGVSVMFLAINCFVQYLWCLWAIFAGDISIIISGGSVGTLALANLILYYKRASAK